MSEFRNTLRTVNPIVGFLPPLKIFSDGIEGGLERVDGEVSAKTEYVTLIPLFFSSYFCSRN